MSVVRFPSINLELYISKIAFSVFGIEIYNYAICIVSGIIIALFLCKISKEKFNIDNDIVLENCIVGLIFGIIGARIYFVLFNLEYYYKNILEVLNFRDGGLAIYGGLILGTIAILINCKIKKVDILNLLDYIVPYVAIAQSIGRWGNFFNVEAFGEETSSIFRMGIETVEKGYIEVHPVFLYESILTFIIFLLLTNLQRKRVFKGQILLNYCLFYSGIRIILEGLRVDSLMLFNFKISQILSIIIFLVSIFILYKRLKDTKKELIKNKVNDIKSMKKI